MSAKGRGTLYDDITKEVSGPEDELPPPPASMYQLVCSCGLMDEVTPPKGGPTTTINEGGVCPMLQEQQHERSLAALHGDMQGCRLVTVLKVDDSRVSAGQCCRLKQ